MIWICADIGPSYVQGADLGAAITQVIHPQPREEEEEVTCFICGYKEHFARNCSDATVGTTQTLSVPPMKPTICPKCRQGYHWAIKCRSKTNAEGWSTSGNFHWGHLQPHQTMRVLSLIPPWPYPQPPSMLFTKDSRGLDLTPSPKLGRTPKMEPQIIPAGF